MKDIVNVSSNRSNPIRTMTRIVNLGIAITLPVMLILYPPVKPTWLVMGTFLSIVLGLFSIIGLWPRMRVTLLGHAIHNPAVHTTAYFLVGMICISLSFANPSVSTSWFAFFTLVGAMMVFDAITSMTYLFKDSKSQNTIKHEETVTHHHDRAA